MLAPYWPERWRYVLAQYQNLPFPFEEIAAPAFEMEATWDLDQLVGYLNSWSAALAYRNDRGQPAADAILPELIGAWGRPERTRLIRLPLSLRVGRSPAPGTSIS